MLMEEEASASPSLQGEVEDEYDSKESVLQRYFLQEWKLVKSLLDNIVSARRVSDLSAVQKIRSIVISDCEVYVLHCWNLGGLFLVLL